MATVVSHQKVHGVKGDSGPLSDMVEPNPVDEARKGLLLTEGDSNSNESWCYWVPFPGVRYYCFGDHPSRMGRVKRA